MLVPQNPGESAQRGEAYCCRCAGTRLQGEARWTGKGALAEQVPSELFPSAPVGFSTLLRKTLFLSATAGSETELAWQQRTHDPARDTASLDATSLKG